jgi:GDP-L-fucose synthase|tara:strand:- start:671 stop:1639 length:969 start_codon:yes stop_codon:yes gene_type:complete
LIQTTFNNFSLSGKRIFVAGHTGMVGSAIVRLLNNIDCEILTVSSQELDLKQSSKVDKWFDEHRPDAVFLAAAKVGGILANSSYPADFLIDNLSIQNSVITNAFKYKVKKLMFLGSSCIYPRNAKQPIKESSLLTGILEPTNEAYAIAKIAGIKLCQFYRKQYGVDYVSVMPTNLYGPGDNFHPKNSHVVAALISKFYEAVKLNKEEVIIWGTGKPLREFMHVDDLAEGLIFLMENYSEYEHVNIGTGKEISITEFAKIIKNISGWKGKIKFDDSYPDGMPRKVMDINKISKLGWYSKIELEVGLKQAYKWFIDNYDHIKKK